MEHREAADADLSRRSGLDILLLCLIENGKVTGVLDQLGDEGPQLLLVRVAFLELLKDRDPEQLLLRVDDQSVVGDLGVLLGLLLQSVCEDGAGDSLVEGGKSRVIAKAFGERLPY